MVVVESIYRVNGVRQQGKRRKLAERAAVGGCMCVCKIFYSQLNAADSAFAYCVLLLILCDILEIRHRLRCVPLYAARKWGQ